MPINLISQKNQQKIWLTHRELLIAFAALLVFAVSWLFPVKSIAESLFASVILLFVFPAVVIKFLLKEPLSKYGLTPGNFKTGTIFAVSFAAATIAIMFFVTRMPSLRNQINLLAGIDQSFLYFLAAELFIVPVIFFSREFFFRGFIQLGLEARLGSWAILAQTALFTLLFVKSSWLELIYALLSALAAGFIAKFSRSIYYSLLALWIISLIIDILILRMASHGA
jgi:membrane protease YdiL (CAAX protease family)